MGCPLRLVRRGLGHVAQQVLLHLPVVVHVGAVRGRTRVRLGHRLFRWCLWGRARRRRRLRLRGGGKQRLLQLLVERATLKSVHPLLKCAVCEQVPRTERSAPCLGAAAGEPRGELHRAAVPGQAASPDAAYTHYRPALAQGAWLSMLARTPQRSVQGPPMVRQPPRRAGAVTRCATGGRSWQKRQTSSLVPSRRFDIQFVPAAAARPAAA